MRSMERCRLPGVLGPSAAGLGGSCFHPHLSQGCAGDPVLPGGAAACVCRAVFPLCQPGWHRGAKCICQHRSLRRRGFDAWVGKIPWRKERPSTPVLLPGRSHRQRSLAGYSPGAAELSTAQQQPDVTAGAWAATQTLRGSYMEPGNSRAARQKSRTPMAVELTGPLDQMAAGTGQTPARLHSWMDVGHFHHNVRNLRAEGKLPCSHHEPGQVSGAPGGLGSGFRLHQRPGGGQESKWPQAGAQLLGEGFQLGLLPPPQHADPEGVSCPLATPSEALGGNSGPHEVEAAMEEEAWGPVEGQASWGRRGRAQGRVTGLQRGPGQWSPSRDVLRPGEADMKRRETQTKWCQWGPARDLRDAGQCPVRAPNPGVRGVSARPSPVPSPQQTKCGSSAGHVWKGGAVWP